MGTLIKVKCPWELQISTIAQPQFKRDDTIDENMVSLIILIIFIVNRNFNLNHQIFYFKKIFKKTTTKGRFHQRSLHRACLFSGLFLFITMGYLQKQKLACF